MRFDRCRTSSLRFGPKTMTPLALVVVALALLVTAGAPAGLANPSDPAAALTSADLYLTDSTDPLLTPLDAETLGDLTGGSAIDLGQPVPPEVDWRPAWAVSADGSTAATLEWDERVTVAIRDLTTGEERARFEPPANSGWPMLSRDGSRLMLTSYVTGVIQGLQPRAWTVLDTADGRLISRVETKGAPWENVVIDPDVRRLYRLAAPETTAEVGSRPIEIIAYDLTSGAEVGTLELSEVLAGWWTPDGQDMHFSHYQSPGVAFSPDGTRIAFVGTDGDAITLVDAERLTVERTVALTKPMRLRDRLFGWLSFAPQEAAAKGAQGIGLEAVFSADGAYLYVYGAEQTLEKPNDTGTDFRQWAHGLGLKVIEVASGEIVAELEDGLFGQVLPAPDGESLYVAGPESGRQLLAWVTMPEDYVWPDYVLWRLDATTLEVLAERELPSYKRIVLRPMVPGTHEPAGQF